MTHRKCPPNFELLVALNLFVLLMAFWDIFHHKCQRLFIRYATFAGSLSQSVFVEQWGLSLDSTVAEGCEQLALLCAH